MTVLCRITEYVPGNLCGIIFFSDIFDICECVIRPVVTLHDCECVIRPEVTLHDCECVIRPVVTLLDCECVIHPEVTA